MASSGAHAYAYDTIVVGAGLTGALVASALAEEGLRVVVLDAASAPGGTLRDGPGLVTLGTLEPFTDLVDQQGEDIATRLWAFTRSNRDRLAAVIEQTGEKPRRIGSLRLAVDSQQTRSFRESVAVLQAYGYKVELEDDSGYGDLAAISTSGDLLISPQDLIHKLLDHENIIVEFEAEVSAVKRRKGDGVAVWAHNRYLWADKVVLANGIHAGRMHTRLRNMLDTACVHTIELQNTNDLARPLVLDNGHICFLPYGERAYLIGWDHHEQQVLRTLVPIAEQLCPEALVHHRATHWVSSTADDLPIVGRLPDIDDVYVVNGLGPWGLNLAAIVADQTVDLLLKEQRSELFDLERLT